MAHAKFLAHAHDPLIQAQTRLDADGEQVQPVGETESDPLSAFFNRKVQPKIGDEEAHNKSDQEEEEIATGQNGDHAPQDNGQD